MMTQLEQYKKAYATLVGMVDRTISALEATPASVMMKVPSASPPSVFPRLLFTGSQLHRL